MENTSHSPEEIKKMRDIAIKYMKELHKQSGNTTKENKNSPIKNVKKHTFKYAKRKKPFENILSTLFKDPDKTLILILIILLMDNEENFNLIMVLIYLLM